MSVRIRHHGRDRIIHGVLIGHAPGAGGDDLTRARKSSDAWARLANVPDLRILRHAPPTGSRH